MYLLKMRLKWFITNIINWVFQRQKTKDKPIILKDDHPSIDRNDRFIPLEASILLQDKNTSFPVPFELSPDKLITKWLDGDLLPEMNRFIKTQRSQHTQKAYETDLKQFIGYLRSKNLKPDIDALLSYREHLITEPHNGGLGMTRTSANRKFATVRSFLNWLQTRGKIQENPSVWIKNFRAQTESPTHDFSDIEVARILDLPNLQTKSGLMHSTILHLLFFLGLRRGEVVILKASHLGFVRSEEGSVMTIRISGKGDKERILPLPQPVKAILDEYMSRNKISIGQDVYLFKPVRNNVTKNKDKHIDSHSIYYIVKKYSELASVENKVSPHSCRATCISNALDHSASHRAVQELAGWSSPLMVARYDKRRTNIKQSATHVVSYG